MNQTISLNNSLYCCSNGSAGLEELITNTSDIIPYGERPETYIIPLLFFLIFVIGVVGNGTLVVIFLKHRNMRNVPNTYILSLALADLLVILTSVPFTSIIYTMESWPWGELICKISETAKDVSIGVSVFTLTALSADRFFAIVDPLKKFHTSGVLYVITPVTLSMPGWISVIQAIFYNNGWTETSLMITNWPILMSSLLIIDSVLCCSWLRYSIEKTLGSMVGGANGGGSRRATRITLCIVIAIWILAILCAIPAAVGSHIKGIPEGNVQFFVCYPFPLHWMDGKYPKVMVLGKFLILYIIPLTIIGIFYLSMAVFLILSTRNMPGEIQGMHRQIKARKKVAVTVLVFVAVFAVCFAPLHAFMLFFYFHPQSLELYNAFWHYLRIIGFCLCYINSCANPVALYFVSGAFRKYFNRYLLCSEQKRFLSSQYGPRNTSMSMVSMKRNKSVMSRKGTICTNRRLDTAAPQETSVTLLGTGGFYVCTNL